MGDGTPNDWRAMDASRATSFPIELDGETVDAYPGETVSGLLWRLAQPVCRWTDHLAEPRGYFCGMVRDWRSW